MRKAFLQSVVYFVLGLVGASAGCGAASVVAYPLPLCYKASDQLTLKVDSTDVPVIANSDVYDYANFSFAGPITVTITASEPITSSSVSPLAFNIPTKVDGNTLTFTLYKSMYLIVKINDLREVAIAADDLEGKVPAASGPNIFNITSEPYQADSSGEKLATVAIQGAINAATKAGGGIVYVPPGVYKSGNLVLKSNVWLYLAGGSVIRASDDPKDFTKHFRKDSVKMDGTWFIYTEANARNIKISGRGTLDSNGLFLRSSRRYLTNLLVPLQCSNFLVDGITLRDSGLWALIVTRSDHVTIQNTKHYNENDRNTEDDAMDIQESQSVLVRHTIAISEDDTYSTKTWEAKTDIAAQWPGNPEILSDVVFDDCVAWSRCATFKIGFGNVQTQRNVTYKNSYSYKSMRAIALNHKWGRPPSENVTFENIDIEDFWARAGSQERWLDFSADSGPVTDTVVKNINVRQVGKDGSVLRGANANAMMKGVKFEDVYVQDVPATSLKAMNITITNKFVKNVTFSTSPRVEAEANSSASGVSLEKCLDMGGGQNVTDCQNGDWLEFKNVNFGAGSRLQMVARIAAATAGGEIQFRVDNPAGPLIGAIPVPITGGWQTWQTLSVPLKAGAGTHTLYVTFKGPEGANVANVNWLRMEPAVAVAAPL